MGLFAAPVIYTTVAAIGTMCIPLLTDLGYDRDFVTAMIAVAGGLKSSFHQVFHLLLMD